MNIPKDLLYSASHEWVKFTGETTAQVGLTDHAQKELGDLVFVNLPAVGDTVSTGEAFGDVESVKAVSDVYSPVSGSVIASNDDLLDNPALINDNCYNAWMIEVEGIGSKDGLLSAEEYEALLNKEG